MAVSRMKKIQILAHKGAGAKVVAALRDAGALHITEPSVETSWSSDGEGRRDAERALQGRRAKLEYLRNFLKPHAPKGKPLEKMFHPRVEFEPESHRALVSSLDVDKLYESGVDLEGRMRSAEAEIGRKESLAAQLESWAGLGAGIESVRDTDRTRIEFLNVEASDAGALSEELRSEAGPSELSEISRSGSTVHLVAFYLKADEPAVAQILKRHSARRIDFAGVSGTPREAAARLRSEADELRAGEDSLEDEAVELATGYENVLVVLDETTEDLAKTAVGERFAETRAAFVVEGWIRACDEERVREALSDVASEVAVQTRDPEQGEEIPIALDNPAVVTPFEFVTTLYGRPIYWEYDPTPFLAPFFIVFFGLCVSDGGYGLTLAALTFFFMRKMQPGGGRQLMRLMFMGGISTAIVGAITGGWFGIDPAIMPSWLRAAIVMNPLQEPMKMLNVVFILGIIQIFTGLAIRMFAEFREGRWLDGILDQLVWIFFLTFLAPLGYSFILGGVVPPAVSAFCTKGAMVSGLIVVATGARKNPNPVMKILGGVLKLYDIVGYFGDVLSYARLLALGLATGAIAMAINGVAEMAMGIPIAGPVAAVLVLIGGHLFNIAVNCLGGFVHSGRLQYLEFFSKFFQGGGRAFQPFEVQRKYSMVRAPGESPRGR